MPIDDSPEFLSCVELWIQGECDMAVIRRAHNDRSRSGVDKSREVATKTGGENRVAADVTKTKFQDLD